LGRVVELALVLAAALLGSFGRPTELVVTVTTAPDLPPIAVAGAEVHEALSAAA
jgi:hypothetical protein